MPDDKTAPDGLLNAVWSTPDGRAPRVMVGSGHHDDEGDHFLCLPNRKRARVLVPVRARSAGSVTAANLSLRRPRQRLGRGLLAAALVTDIPRRALPGSLVRVEVADPQVPPLLTALRTGWRHDVAGIGLSVRAITPNYKPSLVAVDRSGRVVGYAKVGWNEATRERLGVEAGALTALSKGESHGLRVPEVEAELTWNGRYILVVRPLPAESRPYPRRAAAPLSLVRAALADPQRPVIDSQVLAERLATSVAEHDAGSLADSAHAFAQRFSQRHAGHTLPEGMRHGDWVPWNLGTVRGELWAWDWEYAEQGSTPLLDVAHWHLQIARFVEQRSVEEAFTLLESRLAPDLAKLGLGQEFSDAIRGLAVLELTQRQAALATGTGMWREGVRPGLLSLLRR